jgi:hypothetical protein
MTRTYLSGIAGAALLSLRAGTPAHAQALGYTYWGYVSGGTGWGCRTCGYSNGSSFTGLRDPDILVASPGGAVQARTTVTLPSGKIIGPR